jgi:hypothetical protein
MGEAPEGLFRRRESHSFSGAGTSQGLRPGSLGSTTYSAGSANEHAIVREEIWRDQSGLAPKPFG